MFDKIIIFSLVILALVPATTLVYAQEEIEVEFPFTYTQSVVRNSDGQLVAYQENYSPRIGNENRLNEFLVSQADSEEVNVRMLDINGDLYPMFEIETHETFTFYQLRAWDELLAKIGEEFYQLSIIFHEGYPVLEGDELTIRWVFVRSS